MSTEIRNKAGEIIDYTFHDVGSEQVVVIGHGVTGNKDRPLVLALAEGLAGAGISSLRFSFSGNGDSEGTFLDSNITKELSDLTAVINFVENLGKKVIYAGHSMGGAVGVSVASEDDRILGLVSLAGMGGAVGVSIASKDDRILGLVSLAGMVNTKKFAETEFGDVTPDEGLMWDDEDCPLSQSFMDDLVGIDTLLGKGELIKVPWLLVHGTEDDVVLIDDTNEIYEKAGERRSKLIIDGADHVFSEPEHMKKMVDGVLEWLS